MLSWRGLQSVGGAEQFVKTKLQLTVLFFGVNKVSNHIIQTTLCLLFYKLFYINSISYMYLHKTSADYTFVCKCETVHWNNMQ